MNMPYAPPSYLLSKFKRLSEDEAGQTMVEYVMLLVLVALTVFILSPNVRDGILHVFQNTSSVLK
jgi:Flp pilus assembly pilin Flp